MPKISRPVVYSLLAVVAVAAWVMTSDDTPTRRTTRPRTAARKTAADSRYTEADYKAKFPPVVTVTARAFKPVVARRPAGAPALVDNGGVPAAFAEGAGSWVCTGSVEVDGVRMAVLENKATGEGVFLREGERWKNAVVSQVLSDAVVLVGPGGEASTIRVRSDEPAAEEPAVEPLSVGPALSGPIGRGLGIRPERGAAQPAPPTPQPAVEAEPPAMEVTDGD